MTNDLAPQKLPTKGGLISIEVAEGEFDRFLEYYDLVEDDDPEDPIGEIIKTLRKKMVRAFHKGWFELEEDDRGRLFVLHHLRCEMPGLPKTLKYKPLNVKAKLAMKDGTIQRRGETVQKGQHEKMYLLLGSLSGIEESVMRRIEGPDVGLMEYLSTIFLAV
jgi:hypothetical protein